MQLHSPFCIGPRLTPSLKIASHCLQDGIGWLSYDNGRFVIDLPDGTEHKVTDFRPGHGSTLEKQFAAILSFLSACAESRRYGLRVHGDAMEGENSDLFPDSVGAWAETFTDEIDMLHYEIEQGNELITNDDEPSNPNATAQQPFPKGRWS